MKCIRCDTQYQKNTTHCIVCNFPIDNTGDTIKPSHYRKHKLETIDNIQNSSTHEEFTGFLKCNIKKYIDRYPDKDGINDLKKARWYLDKWIEAEQ